MFEIIDTVHAPDRKRWIEGCNYTLASSIQQLEDYVGPAIEQGLPVGADCETNSLAVFYPRADFRLVGLNLSVSQGTGMYVPVGHLVGYEKNLPTERVIEVMQRIDKACQTLWYNYKFDGETLLRCTGWEPTQWHEIMFPVWMYDPNQKQFGLKEVARRVLGLEMIKYVDITSGATLTFDQIDPTEAINYAGQDADLPRRLWHLPQIQDCLRRYSQVYVLERAFTPVLRRALRTGCYLDPARLDALDVEVKQAIEEARKAVFEVAGGEFNLNSTPQIAALLTRLGVPIEERTPSGAVATGKEILEKYVNSHPFVASIVRFREVNALEQNYSRKMRAGVERYGAHVWFPFSQIGAPTGRMSSGGEDTLDNGFIPVNVQSTPDPEKKEYLPDLRSAFIAADPQAPDFDDWAVVSIDYSQIELRIAANLSREPMWIDAFKNGVDIHARNAQLAYKDPTIHAKHPKRKKGKTMGFAVLFGASDETVAEHGGIEVSEAAELLANFWSGAPRLRQWIDQTHARVAVEQKVTTWLGRTRPLQAYFASKNYSMIEEAKRLSVNGQIQGGAADIFKLAAVRVDTLLSQEKWHEHCQIMLFMHDELVFRCRKAMVPIIVPAVRAVMESIQIKDWPVPFTTDAEIGLNWSPKTGLVSFADWGKPPEAPPSPSPVTVESTPTPPQPAVARDPRPAPPTIPPPPPRIGWVRPPLR